MIVERLRLGESTKRILWIDPEDVSYGSDYDPRALCPIEGGRPRNCEPSRGTGLVFAKALIEWRRGRLPKTMGDGSLVEFASIVDTMRCPDGHLADGITADHRLLALTSRHAFEPQHIACADKTLQKSAAVW